MTREIKFRAWDKILKEMFELPFGKNMFWYEENRVDDLTDYEVMQFTGLKDKNGKEIYEADLINHPDYPTPLRVEWDYDQWGLFDGICNEASLSQDCEIVGNIYENPLT